MTWKRVTRPSTTCWWTTSCASSPPSRKSGAARVTTVFVRQGHYALDPKILAAYPPADCTVERIGDLSRTIGRSSWAAGHETKKRHHHCGRQDFGVKCAQASGAELSAIARKLSCSTPKIIWCSVRCWRRWWARRSTPLDVIVPLRQLLPRVFCRTEEVQKIDLATNEVEYQAEDGQCADALRSPGRCLRQCHQPERRARHGRPCVSAQDRGRCRRPALRISWSKWSRPRSAADPARRRWHLTFWWSAAATAASRRRAKSTIWCAAAPAISQLPARRT